MLEQRGDDPLGLLQLVAHGGDQVHVLEHEAAQLLERLEHLVGHRDVLVVAP